MTSPNILLLTIDTLRPDALGCYGSTHSIAPHLDRLAATGVRFDQAITGGSWTQAAFPVLLTSTYASDYGGCLGPLTSNRPSGVEALARAGYQTAAFSSNPLLGISYRYNRGFQHFVDLAPAEEDPLLRSVKGGQLLLRSPLFQRVAAFLGADQRPARVYVSGARVVEAAMSWLSTAGSPFFGWLHFMDTHWPYHLEEQLESPGEIAEMWRDVARFHSVGPNRWVLSEREKEHSVQLYRSAVAHLDGQIGRLLEAFHETPDRGETVVVVVSDHGEEFLEHGRWGHWEDNLFDEILRVPLVLNLAGQKPKRRVVRTQVGTLDLMPTLLDLCGCPCPDEMEGQSLRPLWDGAQGAYRERPVISEMWRDHWHRISIRTPRCKYIWDSRTPDKGGLYDLVDDPRESRNLSQGRPDEVRSFQSQVDRHLEKVRSRLADRQSAPHHDGAMMQRLRGLGYVE